MAQGGCSLEMSSMKNYFILQLFLKNTFFNTMPSHLNLTFTLTFPTEDVVEGH